MTSDERRPLTETIFYVLLALGAPLHGYGIMQQVNELTAGRVALGAGTLYGALTNLTEKGWKRLRPQGSRTLACADAGGRSRSRRELATTARQAVPAKLRLMPLTRRIPRAC